MSLIRKVAPSSVAVGGLLLATVFCACPLRAQDTQGPFHVQAEWKIGGDGFWDYMAVDPALEAALHHARDHVDVVDTHSGKQVADITGLHGTHGVVFSSDGVHGYISDGGANQVVEFNRKTNTMEKTIPAGTSPDGTCSSR